MNRLTYFHFFLTMKIGWDFGDFLKLLIVYYSFGYFSILSSPTPKLWCVFWGVDSKILLKRDPTNLQYHPNIMHCHSLKSPPSSIPTLPYVCFTVNGHGLNWGWSVHYTHLHRCMSSILQFEILTNWACAPANLFSEPKMVSSFLFFFFKISDCA